MSEKLIQNIAHKLGYRHNTQIIQKITENSRLLHLKQNAVMSGLGEMAKLVICTDLAASTIGLSFDMETALKVSGMRKAQYANYRRIIQKLIGNSKSVKIPDLCLQLGLPRHVQEAAIQQLPKYLGYMTRVNRGLDEKHPQYAVIVLYGIARQNKVRVSKSAFANVCNLKTDQWKILEESWGKFNKESQEEVKQKKGEDDVEMVVEECKTEATTDEAEDYEVWKQRILAKAYEDLKRRK
ncbi:origin recognition complex subunit 6 [Phlebotomus argentipes]|uniref:origin recognition complex subunit 6 n=1 Tax=Phlebotomus argentipes TaxID=94469 RepID=UPI002893519E|nr:origin recognition complex subunit 6 [Phlebotomus argentipes]